MLAIDRGIFLYYFNKRQSKLHIYECPLLFPNKYSLHFYNRNKKLNQMSALLGSEMFLRLCLWSYIFCMAFPRFLTGFEFELDNVNFTVSIFLSQIRFLFANHETIYLFVSVYFVPFFCDLP